MHFLRRRFLPALIVLGSNVLCAVPASAQLYGPGAHSLQSIAYVGAGNLSTDGTGNIAIWPSVIQYDPNGLPITATGGQSFTGKDSQGNTQTMTLSGTGKAEADYGVLHAYATGEVDNPYYNAANPTYFAGFTQGGQVNQNGSPQYLQVLGQDLWQDTLTLDPYDSQIVKIKYVFHLDGNVTDDQHAYAYLGFNAGINGIVFGTPTYGLDWVTPDWAVVPGVPIPLYGNFGAVFRVDTNDINTPEGQTVAATADFNDTLTLTGIQLLDANGNQVNGAHYLTASGAHYNVLGGIYGGFTAVPEPGSLAFLAGFGLTGAAFVCRRRTRR